MYVEERVYTLQVGTAGQYFKNYEEFGMKVQLKHLPHMVGYYTTEVGELNLVIHLWAYDDLNQRDKCRAAMQADVGSSRVDLQACKLEYSIVSPK